MSRLKSSQVGLKQKIQLLHSSCSGPQIFSTGNFIQRWKMAYITGYTEQIRGEVRTCIQSTCVFPVSGAYWEKAHFPSHCRVTNHPRGGQKKQDRSRISEGGTSPHPSCLLAEKLAQWAGSGRFSRLFVRTEGEVLNITGREHLRHLFHGNKRKQSSGTRQRAPLMKRDFYLGTFAWEGMLPAPVSFWKRGWTDWERWQADGEHHRVVKRGKHFDKECLTSICGPSL